MAGRISCPTWSACFAPHKWKNSLDFFRVGMLIGFLGYEIGIRYNDEQKTDGVNLTLQTTELRMAAVISQVGYLTVYC